ncbi:MAG: methionyl-tRNA formyltransferase [Bacteroidales bacterium]|jgi:methionyl-tRNA formyltransferase|nr:methionyl-tRNA formyltransferase [Bacteroidales bacterium]
MNGKELKIVFFGTPEFAVAQLDELFLQGYNVVAVVTMPDKFAGRGLKLTVSPVKKYALSSNVPILQPENLKSEEFLTELSKLKADLQVVVAFRMLPKSVYSMPKYGTFNLHASLLPQYRGAAPINWAIINGETKTGLTTFLLNEQVDEGEILLQHSIHIYKEDNVETLYERMMNKGRNLVTKTIDMIASGEIITKKQTEMNIKPSLAPKIFKDTTIINWDNEGEKIVNFVRGLSPYPSAISSFFDKKTGEKYDFKIFDVKFFPTEEKKTSGILFVLDNQKLMVYCCNGIIQILDLQLSGRKRMKAEEFIKGWKVYNDLICIEKK